jgi:hypothetical protein
VKCVHRWVCEAPGGPLIWARCRKCGAERTFPASPEEHDDYGRNRVATARNAAAEARKGKTPAGPCGLCGREIGVGGMGQHRLWHERAKGVA